MNNSTKFLCVLISICLIACSGVTIALNTPSASNQSPEQPASGVSDSASSSPPNQETPVVVLKTEDPNFALVGLFQNRETIIAMTQINESGEVVDVTGAIFIAPDGRSIAFYFENGLPVRAIAEGHVVEFYNFTDTTVDIVIVAPDGTATTQTNIPFDAQKIFKVNKAAQNDSGSGGHLAMPILEAANSDIDWMQFASTALGAFSCAATIASGGTLSVLFGISCAIFVYTAYFQITEKEPPLLVEVGDDAMSVVSCGSEIVEKKYVIAVADCSKLVIDTAQSIQSTSNQTYEKQKRVVDEIKLKSSRSPITGQPSCSGANLTPEECVNVGKHKYHAVTINIVQKVSCRGPWDEHRNLDISFSGNTVTIEGVWWKGTKTFSMTGINNYISIDPPWIYTLLFKETGFVIEEKDDKPDPWCIWTHEFTIAP